MYKTQFFREDRIEDLQESVNSWLAKQQDIFVVNSNISSLVADKGEYYVFYIIYELLKQSASDVQEMVSNQEHNVDSLNKIDLNLQ
jgi:hypothetical protein